MNSKTFEKNLAMLNPEQLEAVETLDGPVMVIAGPGTGKTQIIGMRTANIILKAGVNASNILITTFTEAGVIAIRERLISLIGSEAHKVHVATIHSFAQDVIKTFPEKFTQEKLDTPIDEIESMEILSEIVSRFLKEAKLEYLTSYGDTLFYVRDIKSSIGKLKQEGVTPERFASVIEEETQKSLVWLEEKRKNKRIKKIEKYEQEHQEKIGKLKELQEIFSIYNATLRERGFYDFNDMINFVLERFRSDEYFRSYYAETYQYIMLDEYQDTNNPQNEIINLILSVGDVPNIMVVGDDDQSIYRFQGANIENMLDFTSQYQNAKIIVLDKNYRSQQAILDVSQNLIKSNRERLISRIPGLQKNLFSQLQPLSLEKGEDSGESFVGKREVELYMALSEIDERLYIRESIQKLVGEGVTHREIAIIVRSNKEVENFSEFLKEGGFPVSSKRDSNILDSDYVISIISFLKILENPFIHETIFLNILRSSLTDVSGLDILKISNYLYKENYSRRGKESLKLFSVLQDTAIINSLSLENIRAIENFVSTFIEVQQDFAEHNFLLAFSAFLKKFQIIEHIESSGNFQDIQDVYTLFHQIKSWTQYKKNISLSFVIHKLELYEKYGYQIGRQSQGESEDGIQVLTAHSSKGLEYEYVFISGLYSGNWEDKMTRQLIRLPEGIVGEGLQFAEDTDMSDAEKKKHLKERQQEEDRRLFFVALTRAKKGLTLSFPASIEGKTKIISPFLQELGDIERIESCISQEALGKDMQREILQESKLISYETAELEYIENFLKNYKLSVSDLNAFLVNPKDFLYRTIYRYPFEENENSIFGTMYHRTLELFYKKILETGNIQDYDYMGYVFLRQLEREYLTLEEYERLKKRGSESLKGYYEAYKGSFVAPLKTEYKFSRKNIFFENIPLTGIIDKIELISDAYNPGVNSTPGLGQSTLFSQQIKITDYKTGSVKYIGEIKGVDAEGNIDEGYERGKYGRQLMFYKLLFENDRDLFLHYTLTSLELDFCEGKKGNYKRVEVEVTDEEYESFKKLLKKTYTQMTDIDFWKGYLKKM